ncbi:hypothetical protein GF378_00215 [Candidatus Pacearchaeota archaeon]|nr:hypothetical protein [Candidatus Pacearchaeota archaeon]
MPINIPITINQEKSSRGFKKILYALGVIAALTFLGYLIYRYYKTKNINILYLLGVILGVSGNQLWTFLKPKLKKSTVKVWSILGSIVGLAFFGYLTWNQYIIQNYSGTIIVLLLSLWFIYTLIKGLRIKTK